MAGKKNCKTSPRYVIQRLMEINLLIDDYVYEHKPIPSCSAEKYVKEITSFKRKKGLDARTLQVIDKLLRCMKNIIAEERATIEKFQNNSSDNSHKNDAPLANPLRAEHKSQIDQTIKTTENLVNAPNSNEIISIDLCNDNNDFPNIDFIINIEGERLQSNTSIDIIKDTMTVLNSELNCSPNIASKSVLDNTCNQETIDSIKLIEEESAVSCIETNSSNIKNTKSINNISQMNECTVTTVPKNSTHEGIRNVIKKRLNKMHLPNTKIIKKNENETLKKETVRKNNYKYIKNINKTETKGKENVKQKKDKVKVKSDKQENTKRKRKSTCVENKKSKSSLPSIEKLAIVQNKNESSQNRSIINKSDNSPFNNDQEKNDLSWINDIRYMRKINVDEFDPTLVNLNESFWNDYSLPFHLNDEDFAIY